MTQLSTMQRKIYDYIVTCVREQGIPPPCGRSARQWG